MCRVRAVLVAVVVAGLSACQTGTAQKAAPATDCPASPVFVGTSDGFRGLFRWSGGAIAGPSDVDHKDGSKGQLWILAVEEPPRTMVLRAARSDAATQTSFEVWRYSTDGFNAHAPVRLPNGWSGYLYAATAGGAVLYASGCWRVEGADGSAVTIPVQ